MENSVKPKLWNPNAATLWSLLFSPVFGAWIHAKNWEELGNEEESRNSMKSQMCLEKNILVEL